MVDEVYELLHNPFSFGEGWDEAMKEQCVYPVDGSLTMVNGCMIFI